MGQRIFTSTPHPTLIHRWNRPGLTSLLEVASEAGLPATLADALEDPAFNDVLRAETDQALR
jgi:hypothetical protein